MKSGKCPKCAAERVAHFEKLIDHDGMHHRERLLAQYPTGKVGIVTTLGSITLEAYVCTVCGFFEEYVKAPEAIPWKEVPGLRQVPPPGKQRA